MGPGLATIDALALVTAIARFGRLTPNTVILVGLAMWLLFLGGHYRPGVRLSVLDEAASIAARVIIAVSLGAGYRELVSGHDAFTADRVVVVLAAAGAVIAGRLVAYEVVRLLRRHRVLLRRALVVGSPATVERVVDAIHWTPESGLVAVVAPFDGLEGSDGSDRNGASADWNLGARNDVDVAIVEVSDTTTEAISWLLGSVDEAGPDVYLIPRALLGCPAAVHGADQLWSIPLLPVRRASLRPVTWRMKRILDVVVAATLLLVVAPLIAVCALVLRIEGGPGVLFRQERVGHRGRRFTILKLRTVTARTAGESDSTWRARRDEVRPFARFLRASSIDELPQLWNVLRGEMSLVGPRPERPHFVAKFSESVPGYARRHRVPVGLTGLAQVHGLRGDTSILERARFDNAYIDNWSFRQDLEILVRTPTTMLGRRGRGS